ncbi:MAG: hypothetical protein JW902_08075 [Syntrophaceae bacterium]|nr:hypothetical protein [Syntrophaceae bacterium]
MDGRTVTLQLPEELYLRLQHAAQATKQSLNEVFLRVVQIGSPPGWEDVPAEFQGDIAALDRLDDTVLWRIARQKQSEAEMVRYRELLHKNANGTLTEAETQELQALRMAADRFMLRKAHAVALLRWRGHAIPPADMLERTR